MSFLLQFNGYSFPAGMRPDGGDSPQDLAEQEIPRRQGSVVQVLRKKSRTLQVKGDQTASTADGLQTAVDAMKAACMNSNGPAKLYFGRSDRYYLAQCESWTDGTNDGLTYGLFESFVITFRAADPDAYDASGTETVSMATSGSTTINPTGASTNCNSQAHPVWTLTVDVATSPVDGSAATIVISNAATGEVATLTGVFFQGDVITLDSRLATYGVTYAQGGSDPGPDYGLLSGRIPMLFPGNNAVTITVTTTGSETVSLSAASCVYTGRYV